MEFSLYNIYCGQTSDTNYTKHYKSGNEVKTTTKYSNTEQYRNWINIKLNTDKDYHKIPTEHNLNEHYYIL